MKFISEVSFLSLVHLLIYSMTAVVLRYCPIFLALTKTLQQADLHTCAYTINHKFLAVFLIGTKIRKEVARGC